MWRSAQPTRSHNASLWPLPIRPHQCAHCTVAYTAVVLCRCGDCQCEVRLQAATAESSSVGEQLQSERDEHSRVQGELRARVAALSEDSTAYKLAIERLLAAKASRDRQLAASIAERNKIAQLLARNRAADRELDREDSRRHSTDRLSSGSARRASGNSSSGGVTPQHNTSIRMDEQQQPETARKRDATGESESAEIVKARKGRQSSTSTTPARRSVLGPVSPNSLPAAHSTQQAATSPCSHRTDKGQSERQLMERVDAMLANMAVDTPAGAAPVDGATMLPSSAGWLSREEAMHERRTNSRMKRTIQLLEDKCHELEKVTIPHT